MQDRAHEEVNVVKGHKHLRGDLDVEASVTRISAPGSVEKGV